MSFSASILDITYPPCPHSLDLIILLYGSKMPFQNRNTIKETYINIIRITCVITIIYEFVCCFIGLLYFLSLMHIINISLILTLTLVSLGMKKAVGNILYGIDWKVSKICRGIWYFSGCGRFKNI